MADQDFVFAPPTAQVHVSFGLEPVYNALGSLMLISHMEERSGLAEWVSKTAAAMSPEQVYTHRMIASALYALDPTDAPSFPAMLDRLAQEDPLKIRDRAMEWIHEKELNGLQPPGQDELLNDRQAYLNFIEKVHNEKSGDRDVAFEADLFADAHALLNNPPALKELLLSHFRWMWDEVMRPEWERVVPMLQESIDAFQQLDLSHLTAPDAVRLVTGRDVTGIWGEWPAEIIFIPSAHIGPYLTRFDTPDNKLSRLIFGARLPEGARSKSPALSRSELLVRLSALADDTRLQILELLTQNEELCAQDVVKLLDLSQSAASRHLRQLTATGYLIERRREVAKCYTLNPQRMEDTLRALKGFLRGR